MINNRAMPVLLSARRVATHHRSSTPTVPEHVTFPLWRGCRCGHVDRLRVSRRVRRKDVRIIPLFRWQRKQADKESRCVGTLGPAAVRTRRFLVAAGSGRPIGTLGPSVASRMIDFKATAFAGFACQRPL